MESVLLHAGSALAADVAAQAALDLLLKQGKSLRLMPGFLRALDKGANQLLCVAFGPASALDNQNIFHGFIPCFLRLHQHSKKRIGRLFLLIHKPLNLLRDLSGSLKAGLDGDAG